MALLRRVREGVRVDPEVVASHPAVPDAGRALRAANLAALVPSVCGGLNALFWAATAVVSAMAGGDHGSGVGMFALSLPFAGFALAAGMLASDVPACVRYHRERLPKRLLQVAALGVPFLLLTGVVGASIATTAGVRRWALVDVWLAGGTWCFFASAGLGTLTCGWVWLRYRRTLADIASEWRGFDPMRD